MGVADRLQRLAVFIGMLRHMGPARLVQHQAPCRHRALSTYCLTLYSDANSMVLCGQALHHGDKQGMPKKPVFKFGAQCCAASTSHQEDC